VRDAKRKAIELEKKAAVEKSRAMKAAAVTEEPGAGSSGEKDSTVETKEEESKAKSEYSVFVLLLLLIILLLGFGSIPMLNVVMSSNVDLAGS
jgi:hypothetical protein